MANRDRLNLGKTGQKASICGFPASFLPPPRLSPDTRYARVRGREPFSYKDFLLSPGSSSRATAVVTGRGWEGDLEQRQI